jgi:radical SAM protein with 4Fe4S-binding SPASM domain
VLRLTFDELAFLMDCPATPLTHLSVDSKIFSGKLIQATLYVTRACNLNCIHCYISAGKPLKDELKTHEWFNVIDQLKSLGVEVIYILGGEPLLRNDIFDIISHSTSLDIYTAMSTNGTLVDQEVAGKLKKSGIHEVQVSIDGPNERINSMIRGAGSFQKAINGVKILLEEGIKTTISYVITEFNKDYISDMVKLAKSLGVKTINFSPVQEFGRAKVNNVRLSRSSAVAVYKELKKISMNEKDITITINGFRFYLDDLRGVYESLVKKGVNDDNYYSCPAGRSRLVIDSNGDVYGCELLMLESFREGNVRRDSLKDIWENGFKIFREKRWEKIKECSACKISSLCQGGCPARAYRNNTLYNRDPLCSFGPIT